jgi:hypothetical protein
MKTDTWIAIIILTLVLGVLAGAIHQDTLNYELERAKLQVTCK